MLFTLVPNEQTMWGYIFQLINYHVPPPFPVWVHVVPALDDCRASVPAGEKKIDFSHNLFY